MAVTEAHSAEADKVAAVEMLRVPNLKVKTGRPLSRAIQKDLQAHLSEIKLFECSIGFLDSKNKRITDEKKIVNRANGYILFMRYFFL
jgi:hypothetical protein